MEMVTSYWEVEESQDRYIDITYIARKSWTLSRRFAVSFIVFIRMKLRLRREPTLEGQDEWRTTGWTHWTVIQREY